MGTWFKKPRPKPEHTCSYKIFMLRDEGDDILPGDRYQCECGQVWEVTARYDSYAYDSPQGAWSFAYKRVYAPGVMEDTRDNLFDRKQPPYTDHAEWEIR